MKTLLALAGSLRKASHNRSLLGAAAELAPASVSVVVYDELGSIPLFDEDLENATGGGPEPVRRLRDQVDSADGLLIATPEYNHGIPGVLKNAIDWLSRPADGLSRSGSREVLAGKPVAVVGASGGPFGTRLAQAALRQVLYATECLVLPGPALYVRSAAQLVDQDGRLTDAPTRDRLAAIVAALSAWIDRLRAGAAPGSP